MSNVSQLKIMAAQVNPSRGVGDVAGNLKRHFKMLHEAGSVDLIVMPEQSLTGYPLEDLATQPDVLASAQIAKELLIKETAKTSVAILFGLPEEEDGKVYNVMYLAHEGKVIGKVRKHDLPNSDVFDEKRIFASAESTAPIEFKGRKLGVMICEDFWHTEVSAQLAAQGAEVLIVANASPWNEGKLDKRINDVLRVRVQETGLPVLYVNQIGGIDELVFDGHSMAMNADGELSYLAKGFVETNDVLTLDLSGAKAEFQRSTIEDPQSDLAMMWQALVLGTRDYIIKNGFKKVHLGNSGGIDSALVAAIAVDALGPENVILYRLPSAYTQDDSNDDALETANLLGADCKTIDIWPACQAVTKSLEQYFDTNREDATHANIQARIRGLFLMALSNRNDSLLLSTGNKTEMTAGWATLYGDMNGAFNPIKSLNKLTVYDLAKWRNENYLENVKGPAGQVIAQNSIDKRAKAELGPGNNFDEDTLPPYPIMVDVYRRYIEKNQSIGQIMIETGYEVSHINDAIKRADSAEFKRRQSCPGLKVTERDFGKGYRVPITRPNTIKMLEDIKLVMGG